MTASHPTNGPFQTTGIKICEVTSESAVIWTRLCEHAERVNNPEAETTTDFIYEKNGVKLEWPDQTPVVSYPEGITVETLHGAVPGTAGEVQVWYRLKEQRKWLKTEWQAVDPEADFIAQVPLSGLVPGRRYSIEVHCRKDKRSGSGQVVAGEFKTVPLVSEESPVNFTVVACQGIGTMDIPGRGHQTYGAMQALKPDFFVHTGDILYYDRDPGYAVNEPLAYYRWQRMFSLPENMEFYQRVSSYFMKDDHDTLCNDTWRGCPWNTRQGELTFDDGLRIFKEQTGMNDSETYRTVRWGKHLQIWMVEGRDYRSPNTMEDGPDKTIWGPEQMAWFKKTVQESDATFRILISPTPVVGPDRPGKSDNHSNAAFDFEGNKLREFLAAQKDMIVVCGDRHWQYVSRDNKTGLMEYCTGSVSDAHAGGYRKDLRDTATNLYVAVRGGFLNGRIDLENGSPKLLMRHYSSTGELLNEDIRVAGQR